MLLVVVVVVVRWWWCTASGGGVWVGLPRGRIRGVAMGMPVVDGLCGHGVPVGVAPMGRLCGGWVGHCWCRCRRRVGSTNSRIKVVAESAIELLRQPR